MKIICFHSPEEENGYLSNWYPSPFKIGDKQFSSAEQYMMYRKALCFKDEGTAKKIIGAEDVRLIKALGREVHDYVDSVWASQREEAVYEGLLAKFKENPELKERLLSTGDALLAECALNDRIWGIGLSMKDVDRLDPDKWRGLNLLGKTLMKVRNTLAQEEAE